MIDRWLELYGDPRLKALTATMRVAAANGILLAEAQGGTANPEPSEPMRWFGVTDLGMVSEAELRQFLLSNGYEQWDSTDTDTVMVEFSLRFGKVVTPIDQAVPPFYLINGTRESVYQLRLRRKGQFSDDWNTSPRSAILDALRANGDVIQEL